MALGISMFIVVDLVLLLLDHIIGEALGASKVILVPNKENPRTVTGVRQTNKLLLLSISVLFEHYHMLRGSI